MAAKQTTRTAATAAVTRAAPTANTSYLEWGPVWAGALMAVAISVILIEFGSAVGLAMGEPVRADNTISYNFVAAALWLLLVSVGSSAAAGYISGRMRMPMGDAGEDEVDFRDGVHGLTAWALATVSMALAGALAGIAGSLVATSPAVDAPQLSENLQVWVANQSVIVAFATAAGAALGAAAAWAASVAGGNHRDNGIALHVVVPAAFRKK
ncbi:hypothetical protein [Salaquimonas pukyongi]|uniref:hypothetical protein n=1 Tax=Salaquimonas pukyongi TaxID=2712698 RepID=UPI00096BA520|nr:hypothetical protein [Salaquimonas pukyongi]